MKGTKWPRSPPHPCEGLAGLEHGDRAAHLLGYADNGHGQQQRDGHDPQQAAAAAVQITEPEDVLARRDPTPSLDPHEDQDRHGRDRRRERIREGQDEEEHGQQGQRSLTRAAAETGLHHPPPQDQRERHGEEPPGLVEVGVEHRVERHPVEAGQGHRGQRDRRSRAEHVAGDEEEPDGGHGQQQRRQRRQHLPGGEAGQRRDAGERVVDGELRLPRRRDLVQRLGDVGAGRIDVLEQLRAAGRDVGVRAGADRGGVMLDEHHGDQGHGQHDDGQIHGPADALERKLGPAVAANRPYRQPEAGDQHRD